MKGRICPVCLCPRKVPRSDSKSRNPELHRRKRFVRNVDHSLLCDSGISRFGPGTGSIGLKAIFGRHKIVNHKIRTNDVSLYRLMKIGAGLPTHQEAKGRAPLENEALFFLTVWLKSIRLPDRTTCCKADFAPPWPECRERIWQA